MKPFALVALVILVVASVAVAQPGAQETSLEQSLRNLIEQPSRNGVSASEQVAQLTRRIDLDESYLTTLTRKHSELLARRGEGAERMAQQISTSAMRIIRTAARLQLDRLRLWQAATVSDLRASSASAREQALRDAVDDYKVRRSEALRGIADVFDRYERDVTESTLKESLARLRRDYEREFRNAPR